MTAEIQETGYMTAGFDEKGNLVESDISFVMATVPGEYGEWMFVVKNGQFLWIKGLSAGKGYEEYAKPEYKLDQEPRANWQELVQSFAAAGVPQANDLQYTVNRVGPGSNCRLEQDRLVLISK